MSQPPAKIYQHLPPKISQPPTENILNPKSTLTSNPPPPHTHTSLFIFFYFYPFSFTFQKKIENFGWGVEPPKPIPLNTPLAGYTDHNLTLQTDKSSIKLQFLKTLLVMALS